MSKQRSKIDSELSDQQPDGLVVNQLDLRAYAKEDALNDGTGDAFQGFYARLISLANAVNRQYVTDPVGKFEKWADNTSEELDEMANNIPTDKDIFIDSLATQTNANLANAEAKHSHRIIRLEKEKHRWHERFPELASNLDKPQEKNAFLLGGLVLFLVAMESIANSRFFAEGSDLGLLGGTLEAITVSLGNVCIPLGLAFFGHRWFYRHDSYRKLGSVMISLFLLWAVGFNFLVAQYRESLIAGIGSSDSSTLNYVLLFALGTAVAGISFWKMWSFLDPFKQAKKCLDDLDDSKKKFEEAVCVNLTEARKKCDDTYRAIQTKGTQIPIRFERFKATYRLVHGDVIAKTNGVFADYHRQYCVMKVDPDPALPVVTSTKFETGERETETTNQGGLQSAEWQSLEGGITRTHTVGIRHNQWDFFLEMKTSLERQIKVATDEWIPKLLNILKKIKQFINSFKEVITAKLLLWETTDQTA